MHPCWTELDRLKFDVFFTDAKEEWGDALRSIIKAGTKSIVGNESCVRRARTNNDRAVFSAFVE